MTRLLIAALLALHNAACLELWVTGVPSPRDAGERSDEAVADTSVAADASIEDAQVSPSSDTAPLRVGAFNVRKLGVDPNTDISLVSQIIDAHFDLLGLVEVMHTGGESHRGYDALLAALGPGWSGQITDAPRPHIDTLFAEYYAVLRRTARVEVCPEFPELVYHPDADGTRAQMRHANHFLREPAFGCYRARHTAEGDGFDFVLGVYHARWGTGAVDDIASELVHLDQVFAEQRARHPGERDFLLVGDLNLDAPSVVALVQATPLLRAPSTTLNREGGRSQQQQRDHILLLDLSSSQEFTGQAEVVDVRSYAGTGAAYVQRVSDHLPVRALFHTGPDDD